MEKIYLMTDSCADIPRDVCEEYNIDVLPIRINYGGTTVKEYYDITPEQYWELLETLDDIPTTSQITIPECIDSFKKALDMGCTHYLGIMINSKGSGGYQSSLIAKNMFLEEYGTEMNIEIIDSKAYTYSYGSVVVNAAEMIKNNEKYDDVIGEVKRRLNCVEGIACAYTLKHLKKSGRISGATAMVGGALGIRPIVHMIDSEVNVIEKVRGEKHIVPYILKTVRDRCENPTENCAYIIHAICPEHDLTALKTGLYDIGFTNVSYIKVGAAITTNIGSRGLGVIFYGKQR